MKKLLLIAILSSTFGFTGLNGMNPDDKKQTGKQRCVAICVATALSLLLGLAQYNLENNK